MAFYDAMVFGRIPVTGFRTGTKEEDMNMNGGQI
jgi:hypothetical protein